MAKKKKIETVEGEIVNDIVLREAPEQRIVNMKDILQPAVTAAQLRVLTSQTPKWAVKARQGRGGKVFKYVPHGYVTDTLNKAFGFDWDLVIEPMADGKMYALELEHTLDKNGNIIKTDRHIAVTGKLIVRVKTKEGTHTITKSGFGSQMWLPTMEFGDALKAARSDLIKTCAFQLGIALDLYWNERAELDDYVKVETAKAESIRIADQLNGIPSKPILLLSKAMNEYGFDGMKVAEICNTSIDLIMAMNEDEISECWKKVKNEGDKSGNNK